MATRTVIEWSGTTSPPSANSAVQYSGGGTGVSVTARGGTLNQLITTSSGKITDSAVIAGTATSLGGYSLSSGASVLAAGTAGVSGMVGSISGTVTTLGGRETANNSITLGPRYEPWFPSFSTWLSAVEKRINAATLPDGYAILESTQWISQEVSTAAIRFFQHTADVLPSEPFIYGSKKGALVAEFAAEGGALTTVIAPNRTALFAVKNGSPDEPIEVIVERGSNRLREEVKEIAQALSGTHGEEMGGSGR